MAASPVDLAEHLPVRLDGPKKPPNGDRNDSGRVCLPEHVAGAGLAGGYNCARWLAPMLQVKGASEKEKPSMRIKFAIRAWPIAPVLLSVALPEPVPRK